MKMNPLHSLNPRQEPNVREMIEEMDAAMEAAIDYTGRMERADEVLEAYWDGQTEDGLKHDNDEAEASPFDGASDQRIRTAEEILNERVLMQKAAMIGGRAHFQPKESGDAPDAALFTTLMGHFTNGVMRTEIRDESEFLLAWKEGFGHSVLHVCWHTERALEPKTITEKDLLQFAVNIGLTNAGLPEAEQLEAAQADGTLDAATAQAVSMIGEMSEDELLDMLIAPARTPDLVKQIMAYDPAVTKPEALRVARALQDGKPGEYFAPYIRESRPKWEALMPFVDVFYPPTVKDLQQSPWVTRVHWLTASQVRDRAKLEKWDPQWTMRVLANPGRQMTFGIDSKSWVMSTAGIRWGLIDDDALISTRRFQIVEHFSRMSSIAGAPCIYRTLLHGSVLNGYGLHEVMPYKHGRYPFVAARRERKKRPLTSSRGIPELVATNQNAIKAMHDGRKDRLALANSPPLIVAGKRSGGRITVGPNQEIPEARAGTLRWMEVPRMDVDTVQMAKDERDMLDRFFGRWSASVPQPLVQLHQQGLTNDWLLDLSEAVMMTAQLVQQYVSAEEASRIVGTDYTLDAARAAIQAQWDLTITFDVRDLDLEWLAKKMKLMNESVLAADTLGVVDRSGWVEFLFAAIDPIMAQRLITPRAKAQKSEMDDEDRALSEIFTGGEPELMQGQDHAGRAKRMVEKVQNSPTRQQLLQTNGEIQKVYENRLKFHETQIKQEQNKQIGRMGGSPVLASAMSNAGNLAA